MHLHCDDDDDDHLCLHFYSFDHHDPDTVLYPFHSLNGLILDLFKKQITLIESEKSSFTLKLRSNEDKLALLRKQLDSSEKHTLEYKKRYEDANRDKLKISEDYSNHITNLQSKKSSLEERCLTLSKALESEKNESSKWKTKYEQALSDQKVDDDRLKAELAALKSRVSAADGRLAASREQAHSAHEEAQEWKRKYDTAVLEAKSSLERAALAQERSAKKTQEREDSLRAAFLGQLADKVR